MPGPIGMGHEAPAFFDLPGPDLNERHPGNIIIFHFLVTLQLAQAYLMRLCGVRATFMLWSTDREPTNMPHSHYFLSSRAIFYII